MGCSLGQYRRTNDSLTTATSRPIRGVGFADGASGLEGECPGWKIIQGLQSACWPHCPSLRIWLLSIDQDGPDAAAPGHGKSGDVRGVGHARLPANIRQYLAIELFSTYWSCRTLGRGNSVRSDRMPLVLNTGSTDCTFHKARINNPDKTSEHDGCSEFHNHQRRSCPVTAVPPVRRTPTRSPLKPASLHARSAGADAEADAR